MKRKVKLICPNCNGIKKVEEEFSVKMIPCPECNGIGSISKAKYNKYMSEQKEYNKKVNKMFGMFKVIQKLAQGF